MTTPLWVWVNSTSENKTVSGCIHKVTSPRALSKDANLKLKLLQSGLSQCNTYKRQRDRPVQTGMGRAKNQWYATFIYMLKCRQTFINVAHHWFLAQMLLLERDATHITIDSNRNYEIIISIRRVSFPIEAHCPYCNSYGKCCWNSEHCGQTTSQKTPSTRDNGTPHKNLTKNCTFNASIPSNKRL